jgi:REP element-mobilizing transposase RayT
MLFPMGFHITWGTYGARLHGSAKPHVDRDHNQYGAPFAPTDSGREQDARRMVEEPVSLTIEQRNIVEDAILDVVSSYGWTAHAIAIQTDHSHVVITAPREGQALRDALKAVACRALNKACGKRTWWAEGGRAKYLWERDYFENAVKYVRDQRDF